MLFLSKQIKGDGRGHHIGFPTINLIVPADLILNEGIYACWVVIDDKTYKGALHYGSIPTFNIKEKTLEVHLIDLNDDNIPDTETAVIEIDIVEKLREVKKFADSEELAIAIARDVEMVKSVLK